MEIKPVKIQAEIMWAFFTEPNSMSGKFQCDLCNLTDNAVKALESMGLQPRKREDKPEKGWFLTVKSNYAIQPYDNSGKEIHDVVGNGSKAIALIKPYEWSWKNKKGVSASLAKIVVTDLVKYEAEEAQNDAFEDADIL